jgi:hypothetical protein
MEVVMKERFVHPVLFIVVALQVLLLSVGCQELSKVSFTVDYETEEFELDLDAQFAVAVANGQVPLWEMLPEGECLDVDVETLRMIFEVPVEDIDLRDSPQGEEVDKYQDRIEAVDIDTLEYVVVDNSLSFNVPQVALSVGDFGAEKDALAWIANTQELAAAQTGNFNVAVTAEMLAELAGRLEDGMKFAYSYDIVGDNPMPLCKGQSLGKIKAKAIIQVTVLAQAL